MLDADRFESSGGASLSKQVDGSILAGGEKAAHYNVLQKIAYTGVVFVLGPLILLTGLTMSPTIDTAFPSLLTIFGGRQAAGVDRLPTGDDGAADDEACGAWLLGAARSR